MSNGSPLPTRILPAGALPAMPLTIDTVDIPDQQATTGGSLFTGQQEQHHRHHHPIRSISHETLSARSPVSVEAEQQQPLAERERPHDLEVAGLHSPRRAYRSPRQGKDSFDGVSPLFQQSPLFSRGHSTERLRDAAVRDRGADFPIVPSRPPLQPTVAFGSVSRFSYYSSATPSALDRKSHAIALAEEISHRLSKPNHSKKSYACFAILYLLVFVCGMNVTCLATALPTLANDLQATAVESFWAASSFLLTATVVQPLCIRLSSAVGSDSLLFIGLMLFLGGSIPCALARNVPVMLIGRAICGAGSGAIGVLAQLILRQVSGSSGEGVLERSADLVYWLGAAVGAIAGGGLAQSAAGFRSVFWINVPLCLIGLIGLPFLLRLAPLEGSLSDRALKIDYYGWVLLAGSIVSILIPLSWAGSTYAWSSWYTLMPLFIGLATLGSWIWYSQYRMEAILPLSIFRSESAAVCCFGIVVHGSLVTALAYLVPIYLFVDLDLTPLMAGFALTPWTLALLLAALVSGILAPILAHRWVMWTGWAVTATALGLLILPMESASSVACVPLAIATGIALGMLAPSLAMTIQGSATTDDETILAAPLQTFFSTLGQTLGLALGSCVFLNSLDTHMRAQPLLVLDADLYQQRAIALVSAIQQLSLEHANLKAELLSSYLGALRSVWITLCVLAGVAFVFSLWFLESPRRPSEQLQPEKEIYYELPTPILHIV